MALLTVRDGNSGLVNLFMPLGDGTSGDPYLGGNVSRVSGQISVLSGHLSVSSGNIQALITSGVMGVASGVVGVLSGTLRLEPNTSGGFTPFCTVWSGLISGINVKATPGQVAGWYLYNRQASGCTVKLYDTSLAGDSTSGTPKLSFDLPASGGASAAPGSVGVQFGSGIGIQVTALPAFSDATAVVNGLVTVNLIYK